MTAAPGKSTHQSLQRAIAIMRAFNEQDPQLSVAELSRRLELHKSTVSRILSTLLNEGLVVQDAQNGKYSLGAGVVTLAGTALGQIGVRGVALPYMESLVEQLNETVVLSILQEDSCVCIAQIPASRSVRYNVWLGRRVPLMASASGRLLVAYGNRPVSHHVRPISYTPPLPDSTLASWQQKIIHQGYSSEMDGFEQGISAVAAPVFDVHGHDIAALSVAGPTFRLNEDRLNKMIPTIQLVAEEISRHRGYMGSYPTMHAAKRA